MTNPHLASVDFYGVREAPIHEKGSLTNSNYTGAFHNHRPWSRLVVSRKSRKGCARDRTK